MIKTYYPVVLQKDGCGYLIWAVDIDGCNSYGDTVVQALENIKEAIGLCIEFADEQGEEIPQPSQPENIDVSQGQILAVAEFDWLAYQKKFNSKAVKKTLTIPMYLNELAEKEHINFSSVLKQALENQLNLR